MKVDHVPTGRTFLREILDSLPTTFDAVTIAEKSRITGLLLDLLGTKDLTDEDKLDGLYRLYVLVSSLKTLVEEPIADEIALGLERLGFMSEFFAIILTEHADSDEEDNIPYSPEVTCVYVDIGEGVRRLFGFPEGVPGQDVFGKPVYPFDLLVRSTKTFKN